MLRNINHKLKKTNPLQFNQLQEFLYQTTFYKKLKKSPICNHFYYNSQPSPHIFAENATKEQKQRKKQQNHRNPRGCSRPYAQSSVNQ